jgi:hypothetical protein
MSPAYSEVSKNCLLSSMTYSQIWLSHIFFWMITNPHARTNKSHTSTTTQHNNGAYPYVQTCGYLLQRPVCCSSLKLKPETLCCLSKMVLAQNFGRICWGSKAVHQWQKSVIINLIWLLLSVSDWPFMMIGPGGLLVVVSHPFTVSVSVLWVGLQKKVNNQT